jgi:hypothetical protein
VKDVWNTGYTNAALAVALPRHEDHSGIRSFLDQAEVPHHDAGEGQMASWPQMRAFAVAQGVDLVIELLAGHSRLLPTGLHSLAWAYHRAPGFAVYLAEAWEKEEDRVVRTARLRQLHTGDWKLDNAVYPEMIAIAWRNLDEWEAGRRVLNAAGPDWRWSLVKAAHLSNRLFILRRTVAICDPASMKLLERVRAVRAGAEVMTADGNVQGGSWLRGLKPVLRPVSRVLPGGLRDKGRRIWKHLSNEV